MFGDSPQDVSSAVGFLRAQVTCTFEKITKAFVLCKARFAPMNVMKGGITSGSPRSTFEKEKLASINRYCEKSIYVDR